MTTGPGTGRLSTSEVARALLDRTPRDRKPDFGVAQVKGVGGATVIEWHANIPVCEEFPTAEEAFQASLRFAAGYADALAPDNLLAQLEASVAAAK